MNTMKEEDKIELIQGLNRVGYTIDRIEFSDGETSRYLDTRVSTRDAINLKISKLKEV